MSTTTTCGCDPSCGPDAATTAPVALPIVWQRLVSRGETCPRCGSTQAAIERAVLDQDTFDQAPTESNRIWIAGRPLEEWIGAQASGTQCCSVCGDRNCRTLEVDGTTYEAVTETLIDKAGLAAASTLVTAQGSDVFA